MSDDFDQWENEVDAARWIPSALAAAAIAAEKYAQANPAPEQPRTVHARETETWRTVYHMGRYWQIGLTRKTGSAHTDYELRGAYVAAPMATWERWSGVVPIGWYGPQVAKISTFRWLNK